MPQNLYLNGWIFCHSCQNTAKLFPVTSHMVMFCSVSSLQMQLPSILSPLPIPLLNSLRKKGKFQGDGKPEVQYSLSFWKLSDTRGYNSTSATDQDICFVLQPPDHSKQKELLPSHSISNHLCANF